ncbi:MAG: glycosyltransferase [Nitrospinota bacterium]|nr:glycosyltransferase [Nitrospinota bacterium]
MVEPVELSIVVPVFNEEPVLNELLQRLKPVCENTGKLYEILFVDDGSSDGSFKILKKFKSENCQVRILCFTRNFGQQAAVLAGFRHSRGGLVVQIDADLQNPPEEIPKLLDALKDQYDLVTTRHKRRKDEFWRVAGSKILQWCGQKFLGKSFRLNLSYFRAMRRGVIEKIDACSDRSRYLAVLVSWMAVPSVEIEVDHHQRSRGETKYGFLDLVKLAWDLVAGYSGTPLRLVTYVGLMGAILGFLLTVFLVFQRVVRGIDIEGFVLLSAVFAFFAGAQLLSIGILGEYVSRIYLQVQNRPDYIIEKEIQ